MKSIHRFTLALALAFATGAQAQNLSIATGGTGGVYYPMGGGLAAALSKYVPGMQATAEVTGGSVDNLKLIGSGQSEIGFSMVTDEFVQVTMLIPGDVDEATEFIRSGLEESGYTIENKSNSQVGDQKSNTLEAVGNERRVVVVVGGGASMEQMSVTYNIEPITPE